MGRRDDDTDSSLDDRRDRKPRHEKSKKKKRKRRYYDDNSVDSRDQKKRRKKDRRRHYYSESSISDEEVDRERKLRKKERRKDKKKKKKHRKEEDRRSNADDDACTALERNYALADALCDAFDHHPALADDLPIMLIRLCNSATFDLSQMEIGAANALANIFTQLADFGVTLEHGEWMWKSPAVAASADELVLIRLVRAMLDQIGVTMDAIDRFENPPVVVSQQQQSSHQLQPDGDIKVGDAASSTVEKQVTQLLQQYRDEDLAKELAGLCEMILAGESIALDGLPDAALRTALESLFDNCGLEKSEMEGDDDDEPSFGYGIPDNNGKQAKAMLATVLNVCNSKPAATKRPIKGPMMNPEAYEGANYDGHESSSDEEGPLPVGAAQQQGPALSDEMIMARAKHRAKELECAKHGVVAGPPDNGNAREEWMLVPGKYDFLGAIKSGNPMKSRQFEAKSKADVASASPVDAKTRAEILAIRQAHDEARGPSLMEQHRAAKKAEALEKAKRGGKDSWKWNRDKDLDSGRRVDKDALNMILGGAGSDLKKKFQSSI